MTDPAAIRLVVPAEPSALRLLIPGQPGPAGGTTVTRLASGPLSGHRVVRASGDLQAVYPDVTAAGDAELLLGVTIAASADETPATIQTAAEIVEPSWSWAVGPVFCGPDGQLTQTPSLNAAWLRQVGVAVAPDRLLVQLRPPFYL